MSLARDNLYDFFQARVDEARDERGVELSEDSARYLAQLLVQRQRHPEDDGETLAELHLEAARAERLQDAMHLYRRLGDRALYTAGYFRESLSRKAVGVQYYADMGGSAYHRVSTLGGGWVTTQDPWTVMFGELARSFRDCLEVLGDVAERNLAEGSDDILALYERWLQTGSPAIERRLRELGLITEAEPA
jgi:hypothetical protein